jgi:hypothetical protein
MEVIAETEAASRVDLKHVCPADTRPVGDLDLQVVCHLVFQITMFLTVMNQVLTFTPTAR